MIPQAFLVLWFLATFLLLWGASLLFRGVAQRWSRHRRCPTCRARMGTGDGLTCPACSATAECVEALSTGAVRWPFILAGVGAMLVSMGGFHAGYVVRAWSAGVGGVYDPPTSAGALGIAVFGLIVCAVGFRGERAKGRRRCPKCWYDMAGAATVCPECGFAARASRDFYRPRRRWRVALAGLAILLAAYPVYITPRVRTGGWIAAIPTWVLIAGLPWWPNSFISDANSPHDEDYTLSGRMSPDGDAAGWEVDLLRWRARGLISGHPKPTDLIHAAVFLEIGSEPRVRDDIVISIAERVVRGSPDDIAALGEVAPVTLEGLLSDEACPGLDPFVPALIGQLDAPPPIGLEWTYWLLARAGPSADPALPRFVEMLRSSGTPNVDAIVLLQSRLATSPATRAAVIRALADPDASIRRGAAIVLRWDPDGKEEDCQALLPLLEDPDDDAAAEACRTLARIGSRPDAVIPAMLRQVHSDRANRARFVPDLRHFPEDAIQRHLPGLLELLSDPSSDVAETALGMIERIAWRSSIDLNPALGALENARFEGDAEKGRLELIDSIKSNAADSQSGSEQGGADGPP